MKKRIKIQGFLIFLALIVFLLLRRFVFAFSRSIYLSIFGIAVVFLGYYLRIVARGLKAQLNPDGKTLIITGVYALTRNPMYLGTLLIGCGLILALFRWWTGILFLAIYLSIYIPQMNQEAQVLLARFGEDFQKYCQNTPKFIPSVKRMFRTSPASYLAIRLGWIYSELLSLLLTLGFILGIKIWGSYH